MFQEGIPPLNELADHGVARVSHGPEPYLLAMRALEAAARAVSGAEITESVSSRESLADA